jgi:hypothetical protein
MHERTHGWSAKVPWQGQGRANEHMANTKASGDNNSIADFANSATKSGAAVPAGRLLRRTEAARMLGVSKSTLRRMEGDALTPVVGPRNVHLFQEEEIRAVVVTRRAHLEVGPAAGDVAAEAFALFDAGVHVVDAVKQLRVPPDVVERLHATWARLRNLMILSVEARSEINTLLLGWDDRSLRTEAEVVGFLKKWMHEDSFRRCSECRAEMASFCRVCAKRWGLTAAREHLAAERARKL